MGGVRTEGGVCGRLGYEARGHCPWAARSDEAGGSFGPQDPGRYSSSGALSGKMMSVYPKRERSRIRIG